MSSIRVRVGLSLLAILGPSQLMFVFGLAVTLEILIDDLASQL